MRPILPPEPAGSSSFSSSSSSSPSSWSSASANRRAQRRRPDLTLPIPQRDPALAVPLLLPPATTSSGPSTNHQSQTQDHKRHQLINPEELERGVRIGSGSGGTVWRVFHRATSRVFALKVIYGNHEDSVRSQICREIEILRDVDHSNVVKCHDMYDRNGEIEVLLEYMDGGSLEGAHIKQEHILSDLARQVLGGLAYLHKRHIVHRDIKPSNLLKNSRKNVKIADFGVGSILAQTMDPCNSAVPTIAYMSPERINTDLNNLNNGRYDGYAGDIWSLGVSILEFYLGRFPFAVGRQGDWASLMCTICFAQPPEAPATASMEFRDFISCCLQKDPHKRWTAAQLLQHPFILRAGQSQVDLERTFVVANFVLELPSAVFDQLSSVRKPQFALLSMLMSFAALFICIVELVNICRKEKVTWKWRGTLPWLYPPQRHKPFGSFKDIIGLLCAICQCIVTTITYIFFLQHADNPIKVSVWPIIFAFGLLCSKFLGNGQRRSTDQDLPLSRDDIL